MHSVPRSTFIAPKAELSIVYAPIDSLHPYDKNARTHTKHQLRQIAESIRVFGFTVTSSLFMEQLLRLAHEHRYL